MTYHLNVNFPISSNSNRKGKIKRLGRTLGGLGEKGMIFLRLKAVGGDTDPPVKER
jgi:hypothetical protein